jgi:hypothetical protein
VSPWRHRRRGREVVCEPTEPGITQYRCKAGNTDLSEAVLNGVDAKGEITVKSDAVKTAPEWFKRTTSCRNE